MNIAEEIGQEIKIASLKERLAKLIRKKKTKSSHNKSQIFVYRQN